MLELDDHRIRGSVGDLPGLESRCRIEQRTPGELEAGSGSNAGDVLPDGPMVFKTGSGQLTVIDLTTIPYAVSGTISLSGPAAGANYIDFAYNAIDGLIYSVDRNTNQLFWIDPDTGHVIGKIDEMEVAQIEE